MFLLLLAQVSENIGEASVSQKLLRQRAYKQVTCLAIQMLEAYKIKSALPYKIFST